MTCSVFTVIVQNISPVAICQTEVTLILDGNGSVTVADIDAGSNDLVDPGCDLSRAIDITTLPVGVDTMVSDMQGFLSISPMHDWI